MGNFSKLLKLANFVLADKFAKIEDIIELEHVEKEDEGANDIMIQSVCLHENKKYNLLISSDLWLRELYLLGPTMIIQLRKNTIKFKMPHWAKPHKIYLHSGSVFPF